MAYLDLLLRIFFFYKLLYSNKDSVLSSFPNPILLISFSFLISLARCQSTFLNGSDGKGYSSFVLDCSVNASRDRPNG